MAIHALRRGEPGFYVYQILVDGCPRYVGKGKGDRPKEHIRTARRVNRLRAEGQSVKTTRFYNRLAASMLAGESVEIDILSIWVDEKSALEAEIEAIASAPDGQLWNVLPGGEGISSEYAKGLWESDGYRTRMSLSSRANWSDPDFRANQIAVRRSPEYQARASAALTEALSNPDVRQKMSQKKREALKDPAYRMKLAEASAKAKTPEKRKKDSERLKANWADPQWREARLIAQRQGKSRPEVRAARSASAKAQQTPEARERTRARMKELWSDPDFKKVALEKLAAGRKKTT